MTVTTCPHVIVSFGRRNSLIKRQQNSWGSASHLPHQRFTFQERSCAGRAAKSTSCGARTVVSAFLLWSFGLHAFSTLIFFKNTCLSFTIFCQRFRRVCTKRMRPRHKHPRCTLSWQICTTASRVLLSFHQSYWQLIVMIFTCWFGSHLHHLLVFTCFFQERKPAKVREQETDGQGRADWEYCVRLVTSGFGALFFQHYYLTIFNPSASFLKFADIYIFWLCYLCCPLFSCQHPLETWKAWNWLPNSANGEQVVEKVLRSPKMVSHSVPARRDEGIWWIVGICFSKGKRRENFGFGHADKTSRCLPCGGLSSNNESGISIKRILSCWPSGHQIRKVYVAENNDIPTTSTLVCYTYCYTSRTVLDA